MNMIEYIIICLILLLFELAYMKAAVKLRIFDTPHRQSSHTGVVVRGGGIVFYMAFLLWALVYGFPSDGRLIGLTILVSVSFADDIHSISPKVRLVCHFIAIVLMFHHSGLIQTSPHVIILLTMACVGAINIYNFMDGINGMTGGYSLVVALALLYANVCVVPFSDTNLIVYVIFSIIIFNIFNFRQHAKCFAGDVGSLSIGFIMAYFTLRLALRGQSMAWMVFLAVYAVDGSMTIIHRIMLGENIMKPHKKHAYQIMANELRMPHLLVSGIYMTLQAICCGLFIIWPNYYTFFIELAVLICMYLVFMKKCYHLHEKSSAFYV